MGEGVLLLFQFKLTHCNGGKQREAGLQGCNFIEYNVFTLISVVEGCFNGGDKTRGFLLKGKENAFASGCC